MNNYPFNQQGSQQNLAQYGFSNVPTTGYYNNQLPMVSTNFYNENQKYQQQLAIQQLISQKRNIFFL